MLIFLVVFYLKRAKEKRKVWLEEREKIKEYGEKINEETRNKDKFQMSYKDIDDDKFDEVVQYIEFLKKNPS